MTKGADYINGLSLSDNAPTTGVLEVYKLPANIFDADKIHVENEYLIIKQKIRVKAACHGIARLLNQSNLVNKKKNLVLDIGRELIADIMAGAIPADPIQKFAIGTGGYIGEPDHNVNPPQPQGTDIALNNEAYEKILDHREKPNRAANTFVGFIDQDNANGILITEWALKSASGVIFSRATTKPILKESGFVYVIRWTIQH